MSNAQTITSKSIASELDRWQISCHSPEPQQWRDVTAQPIVDEEEHTESFSATEATEDQLRSS